MISNYVKHAQKDNRNRMKLHLLNLTFGFWKRSYRALHSTIKAVLLSPCRRQRGEDI
jgi:hypothetical protein